MIIFGKTNLKLVINYLLGNCYVIFGNSTFTQVTDITLASDPALFMRNLSLPYFENK